MHEFIYNRTVFCHPGITVEIEWKLLLFIKELTGSFTLSLLISQNLSFKNVDYTIWPTLVEGRYADQFIESTQEYSNDFHCFDCTVRSSTVADQQYIQPDLQHGGSRFSTNPYQQSEVRTGLQSTIQKFWNVAMWIFAMNGRL